MIVSPLLDYSSPISGGKVKIGVVLLVTSLLWLIQLFFCDIFAAPGRVPEGQHAIGCVDGGALFCLLRHLGLWVDPGGRR